MSRGVLARRHAARALTLALGFLPLAYAGIRGQLHARRQAELEDIVFCRDQLQEALDSQRSDASGPTPKRSATGARPASRAVMEWGAKLKSRLTAFNSTHAPGSTVEDLDLRLSAATLAVAEHRFADALASANALPPQADSESPATRALRAALLRVRADAYYDSGNWSVALETYREVLLRHPDQLTVVERVAACLDSLREVDGARQAHADLAKRLQERGSRLLAQLDHRGAVRDLNKAATIRLWLFEHGRTDLAADLAQSFSSCAAALIEIQNFEPARAYLEQAIDLQRRLIEKENRPELAAALADNHASYAAILLQSGKAEEAIRHYGRAIDLAGQLVQQGQAGLRRKLATHFAYRGLARQVQGQRGAAAEDFRIAAEAFAALGDSGEAGVWRAKALQLAGSSGGGS